VQCPPLRVSELGRSRPCPGTGSPPLRTGPDEVIICLELRADSLSLEPFVPDTDNITNLPTQRSIHLPRQITKELMAKMAPPSPLPEFVYKITPTAPPDPIPEAYPLSDLDRQDGFVHLSTAQQVSTCSSSPSSVLYLD